MAMLLTTDERLRVQFPDLKLDKLLAVHEHPASGYPGFLQQTIVLEKGHAKSSSRRALPKAVIFESDRAVPMRDGVKLYTDVFRPIDSETAKVPALIAWSPYGKSFNGDVHHYDMLGPFSCGVPRESTSGYEKSEGPDPAEWCGRGYAIVNIDARGAKMSEGNTVWWGLQEAEDIYDTIEWVVSTSWCNGSVAMVGNSWLAISQINFASRLEHPALKAMAPMEGLNDPYRDVIARGGKPHHASFHKIVQMGFLGPGYAENMVKMLETRPLYDNYWESKYIDVSKINVPLYVTASYSSGLHTAGSFNTYRDAKTHQKWLRVHPYQEWYDLYRPEVTDELQMFFDRFCKGIDNGWEQATPPVRLSLLGFNGSLAKTIIERSEYEYPLARQSLRSYYLDATDYSLKAKKPATFAEASHEAHSLSASSDFALRFNEYTEVAGYAKVVLWISCAEKDDVDVTVHIRKTDVKGRLLEHLNFPCPVSIEDVPDTNVAKALGPEGYLRASHAISRNDLRMRGNGQEVFYDHDRAEKIPPGTKVRLEITLWPMGMVFEKGEGLLLRISGREMIYPEFEAIKPMAPEDENRGLHVVYTGGSFDSRLILPVI